MLVPKGLAVRTEQKDSSRTARLHKALSALHADARDMVCAGLGPLYSANNFTSQ